MVQIQRLIVSLSQGCRGQIKRNHSEKRTCERIAVEHGVGSATVRRAEKYSRGIDAAEEAVPGAQEEILTGHIKATDEQIVALASIPKEERPAILEELKKKKSDRDDTILERLKPSKPPPKPKSAPQKKSQRQRKTTRRRRQNSRKRQYRHRSPSPHRKRKLSRPAMRHQVFFRAYRVINGTCPKKTRPDCRPRWMPVTRIKQQQPAPSCCANCREQRKILFFDGMLSFKNTRRF